MPKITGFSFGQKQKNDYLYSKYKKQVLVNLIAMETKEKVLRTSTPIAQKEHICVVCGKTIVKGERYLNITIKRNGKLVSRKTHFGCSEKKEQPKVMPMIGQPITEEQFKQSVHDDTLTMLETFTFEENMQIAFVPLIITEVAWKYAYMVLDYAAKERISETKKLSRAVKALREKYLSDCRKDLDRIHMEKMEKASDMFVKSCGNDFSILFFSLSNELNKRWPDLKYFDMRVYAGMAIIMLQLLKEHSKRMDELMSKRLGLDVQVYRNQINDSLMDCMDAYMSPAEFKFDSNVSLSMQIIRKKFNQIQWEVK